MSIELPPCKEIQLIRHGHFISSQDPSFGRANQPLSELGMKQAEALGRYWQKIEEPSPHVVLSSTMWRAAQTAEIAVATAGWNIPVEELDSLREQNYGTLAHLSDSEIFDNYPQEAVKKRQLGYWLYRPPALPGAPKGENWQDVCTRQKWAINWILRAYPNKRVKIFSHCVAIQCIRYVLEEPSFTIENLLSIDTQDVKHCSITTYGLSLGKLALKHKPYFRPPEVIALSDAIPANK